MIRNKPRKKIHKKYAIDHPTFIHIYIYIYIYINVADIYDTKRMRNSNTIKFPLKSNLETKPTTPCP